MNKNPNLKVIVTDLDGTLLNADHLIAPYTQAIFQELHQQGYILIVATGRHHLDAMQLTNALGIPLYLVTSNGARIHGPNQELLYTFDIASEAVAQLLALDIDPSITTVLFKEEFWYTNKENQKLNSFQKEMHYPYEIVDYSTLTDLSAIKILFVDEDHDKLLQLDHQIKALHSSIFETSFSLPICLEIMDKRMDKSFAIAKILELENSSFAETICFGDGFNDERMLLQAHKGLIMQNAQQTLKDKLHHLEVIGTNEEEAVAKYLETEVLCKVEKG